MFHGHTKQVDIFKRLIKQDKLSHAYLFSGINGIGKRLFATYVAKALVCERGAYFVHCDCPACAQVDMGVHPDVYYYGRDELKVENARSIIESASMTPLVAKWKVYVLDGVEVFSASQHVAGNALLKTFEEPGSNSLFLMLTDRYDLMMPTIKSRVHHIPFSPLRVEDIRNIVSEIRQGVSFVDKAALLSCGSVEKTLQILDSDLTDIVEYVEEQKFTPFIERVLKDTEKDNDKLRLIMSFIYKSALERYKHTGNYEFARLGEYMLDIIKRLNYNTNANLVRADFVSKVTEVYSEKV